MARCRAPRAPLRLHALKRAAKARAFSSSSSIRTPSARPEAVEHSMSQSKTSTTLCRRQGLQQDIDGADSLVADKSDFI